MKKILIVSILLAAFLFSGVVYAEELNLEDIYNEQFEASGAGDMSSALPDEVQEKLDDMNISEYGVSWTENFTPGNIFAEVWKFFKSGFKLPLSSGVAILAILLFSTAAGGLAKDDKILKYVVSIGITAAAVIPAVSSVISCISAIKSAGVFMLSFVPVYAAVLGARGKTLTAAGFSTVMLAASEAVTALCSFVIVPLTGMQLALGISGSVSGINADSFGKALKKAATWTLSLASTVLLGLLGIQTVINGPADTLSTKTAKFFIGTAVPVVGNTVNEAMSTVRGCLKLLSSSVAVYAVAAVALILLPVIVELLMWRASLLFCSAAAEMLSQEKAAAILKAVDSAVSFVLGIMILIAVLFVISITMVAVV